MTVTTGRVPTDEELLSGLALGDASSAAAFVQRFERRVFGVALGVVGNPSTADEVAQQAFERAWSRAESFDPQRGSVTSWLLAITRNLAIDELRRRRPDAVDPALIDLDQPSDADEPGDAAVLGSQVREINAALEHLPDEQRRAVLLAAWHGRTAGEIAELEGIPLGTAKTRIRSGLRRVRAALVVAIVLVAALGAVAVRQVVEGGAGSPAIQTAELATMEGEPAGAVAIFEEGSWMALRLDRGRPGATYTCELVLDDGTVVTVGTWDAVGGGSGWAGPLSVDADKIEEVRITGTGGAVRAIAELD